MGEKLRNLYAKIKEAGQTLLYDKIMNTYNKVKAFGDNLSEKLKTLLSKAVTRITESWESLCQWLWGKASTSKWVAVVDETVMSSLMGDFLGSLNGFTSWNEDVVKETRGRCHINEPVIEEFAGVFSDLVLQFKSFLMNMPDDTMLRFARLVARVISSSLQS